MKEQSYLVLKPASQETIDAIRKVGARVMAEAAKAMQRAADDAGVRVVSGSQLKKNEAPIKQIPAE